MANKVKHTHTHIQMDRRDVFLVISLLTNTHRLCASRNIYWCNKTPYLHLERAHKLDTLIQDEPSQCFWVDSQQREHMTD